MMNATRGSRLLSLVNGHLPMLVRTLIIETIAAVPFDLIRGYC